MSGDEKLRFRKSCYEHVLSTMKIEGAAIIRKIGGATLIRKLKPQIFGKIEFFSNF